MNQLQMVIDALRNSGGGAMPQQGMQPPMPQEGMPPEGAGMPPGMPPMGGMPPQDPAMQGVPPQGVPPQGGMPPEIEALIRQQMMQAPQ